MISRSWWTAYSEVEKKKKGDVSLKASTIHTAKTSVPSLVRYIALGCFKVELLMSCSQSLFARRPRSNSRRGKRRRGLVRDPGNLALPDYELSNALLDHNRNKD